MTYIDILGIVAAILTTAAYVPQVYKTWKQKSTKDISLFMYLVLLTGVLLWSVYGFYIESLPIILANCITAVLVLFVLIMKLKYK
ncbi:SemiSWEET family sugar transporter [Maribacter aestuarii]|uniref:SemiSWEET family sugar transporter n=1 Tax=Maribacter aestuarii TaxID=1130723 RepID=UPI00248AD83D|nr:SemiSWEET transporter [Maribacter aestuarii]